MLEARVGGSGVHEVSEAELADVAEPLEHRGVDESQGVRIAPDVVPERVADDLEPGLGGGRGLGGGGHGRHRRALKAAGERPRAPTRGGWSGRGRGARAGTRRSPGQGRGPAALTAGAAESANCSKFLTNIAASFRACSS